MLQIVTSYLDSAARNLGRTEQLGVSLKEMFEGYEYTMRTRTNALVA
jgi:hypothetical protein